MKAIHNKKFSPTMSAYEDNNGTIRCFSYSTLIMVLFHDNGDGIQHYETSEKYSVTTSKHHSRFKQVLGAYNVQQVSQQELEAL